MQIKTYVNLYASFKTFTLFKGTELVLESRNNGIHTVTCLIEWEAIESTEFNCAEKAQKYFNALIGEN